MMIDNETDAKRIKQLIGLIQQSTFPNIRGIDAFNIHQTCEWLYKLCLDFENKNKEINNDTLIKETKNEQQVQEQTTEKKECKEVKKVRRCR